AGFANWGGGYPDGEDKGGNIINGEWHFICNYNRPNSLILEIDEENPNYTIKDGMLFNKSLTYLYVVFYDVEEAVLPDTVTSMAYNAFDYCRNLKSVSLPEDLHRLSSFSECTALESIIIPDGLREIEYFTFFNCYSLTYVEIPQSVKSIGRYAFEDCKSLETIKYHGTVEQWEALSKEDKWNDSTYNFTVVCTDGTVNY
ncbi:MAG: leucine-rich repeat domain-containing protein, partial [Clostridia bacterium]|nr:leucine-rich repeat domain-containing protein [Clostridia bacterium]